MPQAVDLLVSYGHEIYIEAGAGRLASYSDQEYTEAGAVMVEKRGTVSMRYHFTGSAF